MLKYHPDKVGDKYIEKCKEITAAYTKIMKNEFDEDALIPKKFREMGFDNNPLPMEYIRRKIELSNKLKNSDKQLEGNIILELKDIERKKKISI